MSPRQVDDLTAWEFTAAIEGWKSANCPEDESMSPPTADEHDEMMAKYG